MAVSYKARVIDYFKFEPRETENPWLDLLRASAIVLVLLRHGQRAIDPNLDHTFTPLGTLFLNGWIGVDLFFVLSGYLIAKQLFVSLGTHGEIPISTYFARRALRILPAYFVALALVASSAFPYFEVNKEALALRVGYHFLLLQDYLPSNLNIVFWSIGVEEKFYLLAPLIMMLCRNLSAQRAMVLLLAIGLLSPLLRLVAYSGLPADFNYATFFAHLRSPFHVNLEPLMCGVALALAQHRGFLTQSFHMGLLVAVLSAFTLLGWSASQEFMAEIGVFDAVFQPLAISVLFGLLTLAAITLAKIALPGKILWRTIARLSYCLYLVHYPIVSLALYFSATAQFSFATFWLVYLFVSLAIAIALHFVIEKPGLMLSAWLRKRNIQSQRFEPLLSSK